VKAWQKWVNPADMSTFSSDYQIFNAEQLSKDEQEIQKRVDRYLFNTRQMTRLTGDIPTLIALQPEITGKQKSLTKEEDSVLKSLGKEYSDRVTNAYKKAEKTLSSNLASPKFINFYQLFQETSQQAFIDPIHLTEAANDIMAQKLYENVERIFSMPLAQNPLNSETAAIPPVPPQPPVPPATTAPSVNLSETLQRVQGL